MFSKSVNDSRVLFKGGWLEKMMVKEIDELVLHIVGKKSQFIDAYSQAHFAIPSAIANDVELDNTELIAQLNAEHDKVQGKIGIDFIFECVGDMVVLGISEISIQGVCTLNILDCWVDKSCEFVIVEHEFLHWCRNRINALQSTSGIHFLAWFEVAQLRHFSERNQRSCTGCQSYQNKFS